MSNWLLKESTIDYNKKLRAVRGKGNFPEILNVQNSWDEASNISDMIIENFTHRGKQYSDHLILSRSSFYTESLEAEFIVRKIPYKKYGGRKFMESAHIKDVVSALRVVNNLQDEIAWMRYLTLWNNIGEANATELIAELLSWDRIEQCIEWLSSRNTLDDAIPNVLKSIVANQSQVHLVVHEAGHLMEQRLSEKYIDWKKRKPDFLVLEMLAGYYGTIGEFLAELILDNSTNISDSPTLQDTELLPSLENDKDCVIISTIHSAKGLEADVCFVLNVSSGSFPSKYSLNSLDAIEEDRRCIYVAMTRARNRLILTREISAIHTATSKNDKAMYFLQGLPNHFMISGIKSDRE